MSRLRTKQEVSDAARVMQAWVDGAQIQVVVRISPLSEWRDIKYPNEPSWNWDEYNYRVKPEPSIVPWSDPKDVPINAVFQHKSCTDGGWFQATGASVEGIDYTSVDGVNQLAYETLFKDYNHSLDGKTWHPCAKVVE